MTKSGPIFLITALFVFSATISVGYSDEVPQHNDNERILDSYGKLPLYFIENRGELDSKVKFYVKTSGQTLYFTGDGIVFDLSRGEKGAGQDKDGAEKPHQERGLKAERLVFNLGFENARKGIPIDGLYRQDARINYFVGNDKSKWKVGIPVYRGIIYKGVYKGIDLRVFGNGRDIEYEFIVNPGGNPSDILLTYNGIAGLATNGEGELLIKTAFGELKERRLYVYQQIKGKKAVDGSFEIRSPVGKSLNGKFSYGFHVASYDSSQPLTIDPTLSYSTYLGGSARESGHGIAIDSFGNAYVTGITYSADFPTQNPYQGIRRGEIDAFVTKFNSSGSSLSYSTYLGGSGYDFGLGIAVDGSGNAYITGITYSADFPMQNPYQEIYAGGDGDAFITKLSSSGSSLSYSTYLGGSNRDCGYGIAVDTLGSAYVIGDTYSADFPTQNPYQGIRRGEIDAFVAKFTPSGSSLSYSTYLGGSGYDGSGPIGPNGIAVDGSGNAYLTGCTDSKDFPMQKPYQAIYGGGYSDAFIVKLTSSGSTIAYSTYLGGSDRDCGYGIAVDGSENVYVTGDTASADFPTQNPYQRALGGSGDAFVTKLNSSGSALSYSTYLGGHGSDTGYGIGVDNLGNSYVIGDTGSTDFPTQNAYQGTPGGLGDAFITKFASSGKTPFYSTYLGGSNSDFGCGIAVDSLGNLYVTGYTESTDFPTKNPYQKSHAGTVDAFITKFCSPSLYVNLSGDCGDKTPCYISMQKAIDDAEMGSIILIADGIYNETVTLDKAKALTLQGGWDASFKTQTGTTILRQAPKAPAGSLTLQMLSIKPE